MCSALIFTAYHFRLQAQQNQIRERLLRNCESGITWLLATQQADTHHTLDLFGQSKDSITISKRQWGMYEIGQVQAYVQGDTLSRTALIGAEPDSIWSSALYLADQGRPVTFAGKTLVKGTAYLPESGVKRGWVDGHNFEYEELIRGAARRSNKHLPILPSKTVTQLLKQVDFKSTNKKSIDLLMQDSVVARFDDPLVKIHGGNTVVKVENIVLKGHIILSSDSMIYVAASARLEQIILSAPKIYFERRFKGNVQAFATDTLVTGEDCHFTFPSTLGMLEIDSIDNRIWMMLGKKCIFEGVMFQYVQFLDRSSSTLHIHPEAIVKGQVYADGLTSLEGKVHGTLVCSKFWMSRPSGVYENHLLDGEIDRTRLSKDFAGSTLFSHRKKRVAKWL